MSWIVNHYPEVLVFLAIVAGGGALWRPKSRAFLEDNSGAVGVIFALIAGVYVLKEHELSVAEDRLDRTRGYIERIESGMVHQSRQWLDLHWIRQSALIAQIDAANKGPTADKDEALRLLAAYESDFEEHDPADERNIAHIMRLFYFYADLAKCVELELCDTKSACDLFKDDIGKFYVLHAEFIERWRNVSFEKNFEAVRSFVRSTCSGRT